MDLTCDNELCRRTFRHTGGPAHLARSKHHYCCRSCQNTTHGQAGTDIHRMWEQAKRRATMRGRAFSLTLADMPEIPKVCPVLGILLECNEKAGPAESSPSLDRIDPGLGYVPGNVRVISFRANRLRSDGTADELRAVADDAARIAR